MPDPIRLELEIKQQPDDVTCGPTCLHAVYRYFGDNISLSQLIQEISMLETGGTLAVMLACHALRRGYKATIYTYNLQLFDPTWFNLDSEALQQKLCAQMAYKPQNKLKIATRAYQEFLSLGGKVRYKELTASLIRGYLRKKVPILTGLSATYLYRTPREHGVSGVYDDIQGYASGHFIVVHAYHREQKLVDVADPLHPNPLSPTPYYKVPIQRLMNAILLGVLTYDANLLILEPNSVEIKQP